jgi:O-methyltransferase
MTMNPVKAAKASIFKMAWALGYKIERISAPPHPHYLELDETYAGVIRAVKPYTLTTHERIRILVDSIKYIARSNISGAIVECGVWRGGSIMAAALTLLEIGDIRDIYLFDTFAGMTEPTDVDVDYVGNSARPRFARSITGDHSEWCYASLEDVRENVLSTGYPEERCHFIKGDVRETIPFDGLGDIALLRLDTDWYESTLHELRHLYPKLQKSGILIIDDYGHWRGCKKAVDEFFGNWGPFLCAVDPTGMVALGSSQGMPGAERRQALAIFTAGSERSTSLVNG